MGGSAYSNLLNVIDEEYLRVQGATCLLDATRCITFEQMLRFRLPADYQLNFHHVALLFCLDANQDGWFSYDDLTSFARFIASFPSSVIESWGGAGDFRESVQARCWLRMRECVLAPVERASDQNDRVLSWFLLFLQRAVPHGFWHQDNQIVYNNVSLNFMFDLLKLENTYKSYQDFFQQLRCCSFLREHSNELTSDASKAPVMTGVFEEMNHVIEENVLKLYLQNFFDGIWRIFDQLGLNALLQPVSIA